MEQKHIYTSDEKIKWWGYGEWVEEPDEVLFEHNGIKCRIVRIAIPDGIKPDGPFHIFGGYLCGYASIPKDHPFFGKNYYDIEIDVHGGLTYSEFKDNEYWIGFDCAHSCDFNPSMQALRKSHDFEDKFPLPEEFKHIPIFNPSYRTIEYCIEECKSMADQINAYKNVEAYLKY
jgi:hypothetical protein